jgi:hypothetical protein
VIVRFPAYRRYSESRIEVNDAMMALLIGARLGEHALRTSAASPEVLLPSLFGQIDGIRRVNRTAGDAARLLADAEMHLAYMAIPYALAVHGTFLVAAAGMVRDDGRDEGDSYGIQRVEDLTRLPLENGHQYVAERCGKMLDGTLPPLFQLARKLRNRIIHFVGTPGSHLLSDYRALPEPARESWEHLAGRPLPDAVVGGRLALGEGELVAVLAVSRNLVQTINDLLAHTLSRRYWASLVVADYRTEYRQRFGERDRRLKRVVGYAGQMYRPLRLTTEEIIEALGEGGSSY